MTKQNVTNAGDLTFIKYALVAALILLAFLMSYQFARGGAAAEASLAGQSATAPGCGSGAGGCGSSGAGGCGSSGAGGCGSGSGQIIEGAATLDPDGIQRISVDVSAGFNPNVIRLAAGVPAQITFGQGAGCFAEVMSRDLGFFQDLTGGPQVISLPALEPGAYEFACGMEMVFGSIVVE
ncbi:MAG: cupredoxin domain-containing protein [Actinobacteria bacterium]|nr:cupredoxin domain-containing protein [Actinomycetota bacterium]MCL5888206.1 cupredoxin domain-containing protein [Actinomycetota bacterium]